MLKRFLTIIFLLLAVSAFTHNEEGNSSNKTFPFIENKGQWHENVLYKAEVSGAAIFFEHSAFHYQFIEQPNPHDGIISNKKKIKGHNFKAVFIGSNENIETSNSYKSEFYYNYFLGNDSSKWKGNVHSYKQIKYHNLYNGIDVSIYESESQLKYDYIISPFAETNQIKVEYIGINKPTIKDGNLIIKHELGTLIESRPIAYQLINGEKIYVKCDYGFNDNDQLIFSFPEGYINSKPLIIDPTLIFSTYSGSASGNFGASATYDSLGYGYMGGTIFLNYYNNTTGAYQPNYGGGMSDIAISKFSPDGSSLIYSTFLGGSKSETMHSMVVNNSYELTILGATSSDDYPTTSSAYQQSKSSSNGVNFIFGYSQNFSNGADIVITKFNPSGASIIGSTYFGGNGEDGLNIGSSTSEIANSDLVYNYGDQFRGEVITDSLGNIYVGTSSRSSDLDTTFLINSKSGTQDGLIIKFNPDLSQPFWFRFHGGNEIDAIYSLKLLDNGKILVGGGTRSYADFPVTPGSYLDSAKRGRADGFISIISSDGKTVERSTFIGTSNYDQVYFIEFDRLNNIYALGQSKGGIFPVKNSSIIDSLAGQFIIKLDPNLDSLIYATTFGDTASNGEVNISPTAFLVDRCFNVYASGWGGSLFSTTNEGFKTLPSTMRLSQNAAYTQTDGNDFYIYVANRLLDNVLYASFIGDQTSADHVDGGTSRFDKDGVIYQSVCASCGTLQSNFPTTPNSYAPTKGIIFSTIDSNQCNNVLFKMDLEVLPNASFIISSDTICAGDSVRIIDNSTGGDVVEYDFFGTKVTSLNLDTVILIPTAGDYTINQVVEDTICLAEEAFSANIFVRPDNINLILSADDTLKCLDSVLLTAFHNNNANRFEWATNDNFTNSTTTLDSTLKTQLQSGSNVFYLKASNSITHACPKIDSIKVFYKIVNSSISLSKDTICEGENISFTSVQQNVDSFRWDLGNGVIKTDTNFTYTYPAPGEYEVRFIYENDDCTKADTLTKIVNIIADNLSFGPFSDSLYCGNGDFEVGISSQGTANRFLFSSDTTFSDTLNNYPNDSTITINSDGDYNYYVQISDGYCYGVDSIQSTYITYEVDMDLITEDSVCTPFNLPISSTVIGVDSFRIDFGNGNSTTTDPNPTVNYTNEGSYQIQLIASNARCNLADTITQQIEVFQNVELLSLSDTLICLGDTIQLSGNSSGTAKRFIWADNSSFLSPINAPQDSVIQISPQAPQNTYYLRGENEICFDEIDVTVDVENLVVETDDILSICLGDTLEVNADVINSTAQLTFDWQPADSIIQGQGSTSILTSPKGTMWFELLTTSSTGCEDLDSVEVEVSVPAFDSVSIFAETDSAYRGQVIPMSTDRNGSNLIYSWEPAELMDNPNSPNPSITIQNTTIVTVSVIDINTGCEVFAQKRIKVYEINCAEPDIFVPTAFTPNGDNNNDVFYVRGSNLHSIELEIYNRWGELVFETDDLNQGWDGIYQGRKADPGVFVYHLRAICLDKQEYFSKGNITLIR